MKKVFTLAMIACFLFVACSRKTSPGKVKATTYSADVLPLIQVKCTPCHLPSKGGNKANFENYMSAQKYAPDMLARVQLNPGDRGFMPFKHAKLPEEEIAIIRKWVNEGTLEK